MTLQQDYATYTYSPNGKRTSVRDANGNLATMAYDGHDRQSRWTFPDGSFEAYDHDANGNRTSLRKRDGSTLTYVYDALNRMTRKTVPERAGLDPIHTRDVAYRYDLLDNQVSARFYAIEGTPVEGVSYDYDTLGRMLWSRIDMGGVVRTTSGHLLRGGEKACDSGALSVAKASLGHARRKRAAQAPDFAAQFRPPSHRTERPLSH
ncbi:MAG TPA: hypothetical protein VGW34_00370 [Allosphingosinicella sp.]|nr:hypothetical protein [Allosphingosinicella sp.]